MAPQQEQVDELFDLKNAFFTGNFQTCINEAQKLKLSDPSLTLERDVLLYRAYLAQRKYRVVLEEVTAGSPALLQPLKTLAQYLSSPAKRDSIVAELDTQMGGNVDVTNHVLLLVAATIYLHAEQPESALRVLHPSDHLECLALRLQALLAINRPDLARKELKAMQEKDEDATVTQLAQAWTNLSSGGEKIQEAYYIFQEMIDKLGSTALLLNGQAVTFLAQGKYAEAETALGEAIEKDPNNPDTLVNMIVLAQHQGKQPEVSNRYLSQLKDLDPTNSFVVKLGQKETDFDRMVKQYAI
jgi:coatomer protein complex subunit epsilon